MIPAVIHKSPGACFPEFIRRIQEYDGLLILSWHTKKHRWLVRRRGRALHTVLTLEGPNGEYREPGDWVLHRLYEMDLARFMVNQSQGAAIEEFEAKRWDKLEAKYERDKESEREQEMSQHILPYALHRASKLSNGAQGRSVVPVDPKTPALTGKRPTKGSVNDQPDGRAGT